MSVVGPVDIGDCGALPDLSADEQIFDQCDSADIRVESYLSPLSPPCRQANLPVNKPARGGLASGMESPMKLVASFIPCFMPEPVHKRGRAIRTRVG